MPWAWDRQTDGRIDGQIAALLNATRIVEKAAFQNRERYRFFRCVAAIKRSARKRAAVKRTSAASRPGLIRLNDERYKLYVSWNAGRPSFSITNKIYKFFTISESRHYRLSSSVSVLSGVICGVLFK